MSSPEEELPLPVFEIDNPAEYGQFLLTNRAEILFYLNLLAKRLSIVTVYIDSGQHFFLSTIVAVDDNENLLLLDPAQATERNSQAQSARQITLVANLDRVRMEIRLPALKTRNYQGHDLLCTAIPSGLLRLQRREFFRLETPHITPLQCQLATKLDDGSTRVFALPLSDISGGGLGLIGDTGIAHYFPRDALFHDCRLEIPGEGVIQVNLRVRKTVEISNRSGHHSLNIGCEFVNLPGTRMAFIERYIARIERERKARGSGLTEH